MTTFADKWIWITGASSGLGKAMAIAFANENAHLILSARNVTKLTEVAKLCKGEGEKQILPLDLAQQDTFPETVRKAVSFGGRIDILINNGGISQRADAVETIPEVTRRLFEINFFGTIELTRLVLPSMIERKSGHIVTMSSIVGKFGSPRRSTYSASKHALHGYFDSLRFEVQDEGIDVTLVCPGFINTDISRHALTAQGEPQNSMDKKTADGLSTDEFSKRILKAIRRKKKEVNIGKYEVMGVYLKRFAPGLFRKMLSKSEVT
ncbi:MAG TPA: SDR family oxidoreductase [Membranihabitans sp.]|nr:SDR family oxidoreductase [Membranihabitans sp.]